MIVAQEKRKTNIAEYVLYMWQVEELIRANKLDMSLIRTNIIGSYTSGNKAEIEAWWENLVEMMRNEGKEHKGHLTVTVNLVNDLYNFHLHMLTLPSEMTYQNAFQVAYSDIEAFSSRQPEGVKMHHIELALSAIYSVFLMKLKGVAITDDTQKAVQRISRFLAILSAKYLENEKQI